MNNNFRFETNFNNPILYDVIFLNDHITTIEFVIRVLKHIFNKEHKQALKLVRKIMLETETFKKYEPEEYRPGVHITEDEELVKAGSEFTQTIFHPVGTCKMGKDDNAVVNDKLYMHGLKNLRVIDASIMPNITSGNTNAPTIMIAEKGAEFILNNQTQ